MAIFKLQYPAPVCHNKHLHCFMSAITCAHAGTRFFVNLDSVISAMVVGTLRRTVSHWFCSTSRFLVQLVSPGSGQQKLKINGGNQCLQQSTA